MSFLSNIFRKTNYRLTIGVGLLIGIPTSWYLLQKRNIQNKRLFYKNAIKDLAFLDFAIGNRYIGRILIGLYTDQVPLSVENFIQLCEGYQVKDKIIGFRNNYIHQIYPSVGMITGDVITGVGTNQLSIYGKKFPDENFDMEFIQDGDVALCNSGPHSNSSQFMITFSPLKVLHGQNVVIGTVLKGMNLVRMIEAYGSRSGKPIESIRIINCGLYKGKEQGPPFFTVTDDSQFIQSKISKDDFKNLSEAEQKKMIDDAQ